MGNGIGVPPAADLRGSQSRRERPEGRSQRPLHPALRRSRATPWPARPLRSARAEQHGLLARQVRRRGWCPGRVRADPRRGTPSALARPCRPARPQVERPAGTGEPACRRRRPGRRDLALEQLLADRIRQRGPDDREALSARRDLARLHATAATGDPAAEFEQLLPDLLRVLGPDHSETLAARHNLARWRADSGDLARAIAEHEQFVPDVLRVFGPGHPRTLALRVSLVNCHSLAGDEESAKAAATEILADHYRMLGPDHPETRKWRRELGVDG
ncbi:tetratricopeptide repeat protein [Lentzea sokolovensis]|uniref:tetratricopeptide repeat protein n=1 Tax=Lentzea sokolovensis TaxID=3095429 RepID=UPI0038735101